MSATADWIKSHAQHVLAAAGALATAIITLLPALNVVDWSAPQTALVLAEAAAGIAFVTAAAAHLWPGTPHEPVALAASFTALVTATLTVGTGFSWWHLTQQQTSAMVAVVAAAIGLVTAVFARGAVKPMASTRENGAVGSLAPDQVGSLPPSAATSGSPGAGPIPATG
jgi:hypothetical protein